MQRCQPSAHSSGLAQALSEAGALIIHAPQALGGESLTLSWVPGSSRAPNCISGALDHAREGSSEGWALSAVPSQPPAFYSRCCPHFPPVRRPTACSTAASVRPHSASALQC